MLQFNIIFCIIFKKVVKSARQCGAVVEALICVMKIHGSSPGDYIFGTIYHLIFSRYLA
jgi:hypothetical protein